ncbi:hypothetical protein ACOMCU_00355 [Lysinibacillus sp. UGB7]|uniref:hypothetical protein n=1 Tax=Lysinibacillus sp. UGB7 TaxID=3411039 RepID=UPI003B7620C0
MIHLNKQAYIKNGLALMIGDFLMIGYARHDISINIEAIMSGKLKYSFVGIVESINPGAFAQNESGYDLRISIFGIEVEKFEFDSLESLKSFASQVDAGVVNIQWDEMLNRAIIAKKQKEMQEELELEQFFIKEGLALTISDYLAIGLRCDAYRSISTLGTSVRGSLKINYSNAFKEMMQSKAENAEPCLTIRYKGSVVSCSTFTSFEEMGEYLKLIDEGVHSIDWTAVKNLANEEYRLRLEMLK